MDNKAERTATLDLHETWDSFGATSSTKLRPEVRHVSTPLGLGALHLCWTGQLLTPGCAPHASRTQARTRIAPLVETISTLTPSPFSDPAKAPSPSERVAGRAVPSRRGGRRRAAECREVRHVHQYRTRVRCGYRLLVIANNPGTATGIRAPS